MDMEPMLQQILTKIENIQTTMQTKFDTLQTNVDSMQTKFDTLQTNVDSMQTKFDTLQTYVDSMQTKFDTLQCKVDKIHDDVKELKTSNEAIKAQTAQLTEFRTEIIEKMDRVMDDFEFLKNKEYQNEKDLFKLKNVVKVVKLVE